MQLIVGPFWSGLLLIPISLMSAFLRIRIAPFLGSLALYQIAMFVIWYSFSNELASDIAEHQIPLVATIVLFNVIVQLPLWWLTGRILSWIRPTRS
jgi:hypothetical protein